MVLVMEIVGMMILMMFSAMMMVTISTSRKKVFPVEIYQLECLFSLSGSSSRGGSRKIMQSIPQKF